MPYVVLCVSVMENEFMEKYVESIHLNQLIHRTCLKQQ